MSSEREAQRLRDGIENIDRIESYTVGLDRESFAADLRTVDAVEGCPQRITEAVTKIGPERMAQISPQTPVDAVRSLGNVLRHDYDQGDLGVIYLTIRESLPELRADCVRALDD